LSYPGPHQNRTGELSTTQREKEGLGVRPGERGGGERSDSTFSGLAGERKRVLAETENGGERGGETSYTISRRKKKKDDFHMMKVAGARRRKRSRLFVQARGKKKSVR